MGISSKLICRDSCRERRPSQLEPSVQSIAAVGSLALFNTTIVLTVVELMQEILQLSVAGMLV